MNKCRTALRSVAIYNTSFQSRPFASTSRYTLDDPFPPSPHQPPTFHQLYPPPTNPPPRTRGRRSSLRRNPSSKLFNSLPSSSSSPSTPLLPSPTPHSDPTQVSPYLPHHTRERNYLLSQLRNALHHSPKRTPPFKARRRGTTKGTRDPDLVWNYLARVLKYPQELPMLPHSHFPTSLRSSSSRQESVGGPFSPSFPPIKQEQEEEEGRRKIELGQEELRKCFEVFAKERPRTRNGLNRLLIVIELIARRSTRGEVAKEEETREGEGDRVERLRGGGRGLRDREWRELVLFVGASMRRTRPDPDTKSVLSLFGQREEGRKRIEEERVQNGKKDKAKVVVVVGREETKMYNALLHVAEKARMWELFDQIQGRMVEKGIRVDGATFVSRIKREMSRGSSLEVVWRHFEEGLRWSMRENEEGVGKRARRESRKVLWNAWVWVLAKRGMVDECEDVYHAMKEGKTVNLERFKPPPSTTNYSYSPNSPFSSSPPSPFDMPSTPPLQVRLPSPDIRLYSSLIQSYSHHGHLKLALLKMFEMIHDSSLPATPQHFHSLFKSFVQYASPSSSFSSDLLVDHASLTGINQHKLRSSSPLSTLLSLSSQRTKPTSSTSSSEHTLSTLLTLYNSFLSLSPAPSSSLPFSGARSAPSPKTIYFLLKAFERLLGKGKEEVLLEVYERVESKFGEGGKWRGWRMDKRIKGIVRGYREEVEEVERRRREVGLM